MKQSFELVGNDPDEILGLRDNKEEINIIPGEVIGGLRGGSPEYFESVEAQIEELETQRAESLVKLIDKVADVLPVSGMINPVLKAIREKNIFGHKVEGLEAGEKIAMLAQTLALAVVYASLVNELVGDGNTKLLEAAIAGKFGALCLQIQPHKEFVMEKLASFSENHPGYSILFEKIQGAVSSLPDKFFDREITSLGLATS